MAESAETASPGHKSGLKAMARKALAPVVAAVVHAASAYLGRKAGSLAQEKLLPMLRERGGSAQAAENGEPTRDTQRRDREKRRSRRREALKQTGST